MQPLMLLFGLQVVVLIALYNKNLKIKRFMKNKIGYFIPLLVTIAYFLTIKQVISPSAYVIIAVPLGIFYFPLSMVVTKTLPYSVHSVSRFQELCSNFLFSIILSLTIISVFLSEVNTVLHVVTAIVATIANIFTIYCYIKEKLSYNLAVYLCFTILAVGILAI